MLDAIKHITDDNFFFQETAHRCIVCITQSNSVKMWFSRFPVLPGSAEAQVTWGGIVKRLLIAYVIRNIPAGKYQNPFMCLKVIARQQWDVFFETRCSGFAHAAGFAAVRRCLRFLVMAILWKRAGHYIFILWFLSSIFCLFFLA